MDVQVPWSGVVLAALSIMVVGMLWYSPLLLGKQWKKLTGIKESDMKKQMGSATVVLAAVAFVTAYIMVHIINYVHYSTDSTWMSASLQTALWAWLGFSVTTIVAHGIFEPRSREVMVINAGNRLVSYLAAAAVLGLFLNSTGL